MENASDIWMNGREQQRRQQPPAVRALELVDDARQVDPGEHRDDEVGEEPDQRDHDDRPERDPPDLLERRRLDAGRPRPPYLAGRPDPSPRRGPRAWSAGRTPQAGGTAARSPARRCRSRPSRRRWRDRGPRTGPSPPGAAPGRPSRRCPAPPPSPHRSRSAPATVGPNEIRCRRRCRARCRGPRSPTDHPPQRLQERVVDLVGCQRVQRTADRLDDQQRVAFGRQPRGNDRQDRNACPVGEERDERLVFDLLEPAEPQSRRLAPMPQRGTTSRTRAGRRARRGRRSSPAGARPSGVDAVASATPRGSSGACRRSVAGTPSCPRAVATCASVRRPPGDPRMR